MVFRSDRRFDVVLVVIVIDQVDMLMLDDGVQFTYLSHNACDTVSQLSLRPGA